MAPLTLSSREQDVLTEVLDCEIADLGMEIADTDRLEFRNQIKAKRDVLRRIVDSMRQSPAKNNSGD
jgi:hypothetical protein